MYCNLSKTQTLPMALRVSSLHTLKTSKIQSFSHGVYPKPSLNPSYTVSRPISFGSVHRGQKGVQLLRNKNVLGGFCGEFELACSKVSGVRCYSSFYNAAEGGKSLPWLGDGSGSGEGLKRRETVVRAKPGSKSSWEVSAEKYLQKNGVAVEKDEGKRESVAVDVREDSQKPRFERDGERAGRRENWQKPRFDRGDDRAGRGRGGREDARGNSQKPRFERYEDGAGRRRNDGMGGRENGQKPRFERYDDRAGSRSNGAMGGRENSQKPRFERYDEGRRRSDAVGERGNGQRPRFERDSDMSGRSRSDAMDVREDGQQPRFERDYGRAGRARSDAVDARANWQKPRVESDDDRADEDGEDEDEEVNDPRWDKIKTRLGSRSYEKPEARRWSKQDNWGEKTYREAHHESTVPKMVGEGVYGIGPVLAALSVGRREFYVLYVQEGLDLSKNNKKKKDKKGFEKVLRIAERISLTVKEVSKHDLNMAADNRPHQGLVLDASPLEMVTIKELDPVSLERDKGVLWVALDEVTDPQNLGAIVRSAYFFGASGVVLCAKNSAPLSGVVSKASAGSLELMEMRSCKNMMQFLSSSADNGWRVLGGSVSSKAVPLREIESGEPTILVLGSEGTGLRTLVERSCTELVRIPSNIPQDVSSEKFGDDEEDVKTDNQELGKEFRSFMAVESLNVSVAAGVLLHHLIGGNYASDSLTGEVDAEESIEIS